jgi:subtilase family serine protease
MRYFHATLAVLSVVLLSPLVLAPLVRAQRPAPVLTQALPPGNDGQSGSASAGTRVAGPEEEAGAVSVIGRVPGEPADAGLVTLTGHVPAVARVAAFDRGLASPTLALNHVQLQLRRSPEKEQALEAAISEIQNSASPNFHKWLTAEEFGAQYGASAEQEQEVSTWLRSNGLSVETINDARTVLEFSGDVAQVQKALHTQIHNLLVGGVQHISATVEPSVPAAIASLIVGVPLSDFQPHAMHTDARSLKLNPKTGKFAPTGAAVAGASPSFAIDYEDAEYQIVSPGDFQKIYHLSTAWSSGYRGKGQTIAVVEDTEMKASDVTTFRKAFGLSGYSGTFLQEAPVGSIPCTNPGVNSDEGEAALDAEWAGATAPEAAIVLAACANTRTQFGGLLALQNLLSQKTPPQVISVSYGQCEGEMGAIAINQFSSAFQQAVAEGVSVFVSSGDSGAASCDAHKQYASAGITSSGFATTPYNVAVGGTDFYDYIQGTESSYWSATNSSTYVTALSYVPEKTWNDSCADSDLIAYAGYATSYGSNGFCNSNNAYDYVNTIGASGGPSAVYLKPSWQNVYGVPTDGVRDVPDVSLFASDGFWTHMLVYCNSDTKTAGSPCVYTNATDTVYNAGGGTSFASPAMAGIFALVTQKYGRQGNPAPGLYTIAATEYGTQGDPDATMLASCNSTLGKSIKATCAFNDVTKGNIAVPCIGTNCFGWSENSYGQAVYGTLSTSTTSFEAAFPAGSGWDYATGLGSINAENLLTQWSLISPPISTGESPIRPIITPQPIAGPIARSVTAK